MEFPLLKPLWKPAREEVELLGKVQGVPRPCDTGVELHERHVPQPQLLETFEFGPAQIFIDAVEF